MTRGHVVGRLGGVGHRLIFRGECYWAAVCGPPGGAVLKGGEDLQVELFIEIGDLVLGCRHEELGGQGHEDAMFAKRLAKFARHEAGMPAGAASKCPRQASSSSLVAPSVARRVLIREPSGINSSRRSFSTGGRRHRLARQSSDWESKRARESRRSSLRIGGLISCPSSRDGELTISGCV